MNKLPLALLIAVGCGHPDPPEITSLTLNPTSVAPGSETTLTVAIANFKLRDPASGHGSALRPLHDEAAEEHDYPDGGHFHVYLDSVETNPMLMNCPEYCEHPGFANTVRLMIPTDAQPGSHAAILRLNADDHTFLNPPIQKETQLTITPPP